MISFGLTRHRSVWHPIPTPSGHRSRTRSGPYRSMCCQRLSMEKGMVATVKEDRMGTWSSFCPISPSLRSLTKTTACIMVVHPANFLTLPPRGWQTSTGGQTTSASTAAGRTRHRPMLAWVDRGAGAGARRKSTLVKVKIQPSSYGSLWLG